MSCLAWLHPSWSSVLRFLNSGVMTLFSSQNLKVLLIFIEAFRAWWLSLSFLCLCIYPSVQGLSSRLSRTIFPTIIFCASIHLAVSLTFLSHNHVDSWIILYVHQIIFTICTHPISVLVLQHYLPTLVITGRDSHLLFSGILDVFENMN